jgi:hypothetical protein
MRAQLLEKGVEKIEDTLDIVKIARQTNIAKIVMKTLFSKTDRFLINSQRTNHLELNGGHTESDEEKLELKS